MFRCTICRFDVELDDVAIPGGARACICVRCYRRETQTEVHMAPKQRREWQRVLGEIA